MEDVQITGIKQQALSGKQGFPGTLKGARCACVSRISGARIFAQGNKNFVFYDATRRCCAQSLIGCPFPTVLSSWGSPESISVELDCLAGLLREVVNNTQYCNMQKSPLYHCDVQTIS